MVIFVYVHWLFLYFLMKCPFGSFAFVKIWVICLLLSFTYIESFLCIVVYMYTHTHTHIYISYIYIYQKYYLQKFLFYVWHLVLLFAKLYFSIVYQWASALYNSKGPRSCFSKHRSSPHPERHSVFLPGLLTPAVACVGVGERAVLYIRGYLAASLVSSS